MKVSNMLVQLFVHLEVQIVQLSLKVDYHICGYTTYSVRISPHFSRFSIMFFNDGAYYPERSIR